MDHKKNLIRALVSSIIISIPLYIITHLFYYFLGFILFNLVGIFVGCSLVDLIEKYRQLKNE